MSLIISKSKRGPPKERQPLIKRKYDVLIPESAPGSMKKFVRLSKFQIPEYTFINRLCLVEKDNDPPVVNSFIHSFIHLFTY
jgi:hypothetical protein